MFKPFRLPAGTAAGAKSALFEAQSEEVKAATALANEEQLLQMTSQTAFTKNNITGQIPASTARLSVLILQSHWIRKP